MVNLVHGQTFVNPLDTLVEGAINYCYEHADRPNPIQDLIDKGFLPEQFTGYDCKAVIELSQTPKDNFTQEQQKPPSQKTVKDCPAIQHVHSGTCMDNADGLAHGSTFNESRSSRLDCAVNEFICKSEGLMK